MERTVFTIGHSNHSQEEFLRLLSLHQIDVVCDVRSAPYSRYNSQFNREVLSEALAAVGINYVFLGKELGARSDDRRCYRDGRVQYDLLARTQLFQSGLDRIQEGVQKGFRIALMCAEKEPLECHRTILVARRLQERGMEVSHIHESGESESHADALRRLAVLVGVPEADLFRSPEELEADAYSLQENRIAYEAPLAAAAGGLR